MKKDVIISSSNTDMLVLSLIEEKDMYGYQIIEELVRRSDRTFELKTGTLYPLLHLLEQKKYLESYDAEAIAGKTRKYYRITAEGKKYLYEKTAEWERYSKAVNNILSNRLILSNV